MLRAQPYDSYADLAEKFKCRCARMRIYYDAGLITEAIHRVEHTRGKAQSVLTSSSRLVGADALRSRTAPSVPNGGDSGQPIGRDEAAALLRRHGVGAKAFPAPPNQAVHEAKIRQQLCAAHRVERPRRRPVIEHLEEIFGR